jgi:hypothetical protein
MIGIRASSIFGEYIGSLPPPISPFSFGDEVVDFHADVVHLLPDFLQLFI